MTVTIEQNKDGHILEITLSGKLSAENYHTFVPEIEYAIEKYGKVRLLVQLHDFHGWEAKGLWEDLKFDWNHYDDIEKLAIVGESEWEKQMARFCKPFTKAEIKFFPMHQRQDARQWVQGL